MDRLGEEKIHHQTTRHSSRGVINGAATPITNSTTRPETSHSSGEKLSRDLSKDQSRDNGRSLRGGRKRLALRAIDEDEDEKEVHDAKLDQNCDVQGETDELDQDNNLDADHDADDKMEDQED